MSGTIAELGIAVDSGQVVKATSDLEKLSKAGGQAEQSATDLMSEMQALERSLASGAKSTLELNKQRESLAKLTKLGAYSESELTKVSAQLDKQQQSLAKSADAQAGSLDKLLNKLDPTRGALAGYNKDLATLSAGFKAGKLDLDQYTAKVGEVNAKIRALDGSGSFVDQLSVGSKSARENVLQLGNALAEGNFRVAAHNVLEIGTNAGTSALQFAALAAPVLAVAAALGLVAYGYAQGSKEQDEYNKQLILTGNYAGTSAGQLADVARQVSATVGTTGQAAAALAQLAGSGKIASGSFQEIAEAALEMEKATGKSVDSTIAEFVKIADDPVAAAKSLNDQYHFLTASVYSQIVALKEQGDTVGAADLLTKTYADTVQARSKQVTDNLGLWEKAWKGVKDAAAGAVDGLKDVGRQKTIDQQIQDLKAQLSGSQAYDVGGLRMNPGAVSSKDRADIQAQINFLELQKEGEATLTQYVGERARIQGEAIEASIKVKGITEATLTAEQKRTKESAEYLRNVEKIRKANPDAVEVQPATVAKALANINDKYKDPKGPANQLNLTGFNDAQNNLKSITGYYQNLEKELDSAQKAGLVSAESYSSQRVAIVEQEKGDVTAAYEAEIAALEAIRDRSSTTGQQRIQLDQKIADARTSMVKAQKDADSQLEVLANNEKGRVEKQTRSINQYVQALDQQQKALELAGQRAVLGVGRGDRQNALNAELNSQQDRFAQQSLDLANQKSDPSRNMSEEEFAKKSQALADANKKATDQIRQNYADVQAAQGDWTSGATAAWENYLDSARDVAGQTKTLFTNAFSSMEDAIVNFATTGKLSFSDFAKSIISDMARIAARQASTGLLSAGISAIGSIFSSGATAGSSQSDYTGAAFQDYVAGARATGGDVAPNSLYQVNELGPELFSQGGKSYLMTGADGGSVTPLGSGGASIAAAAGTGGGSPNVYISIASDGSSQVSSDTSGLESFGKQIGEIAAQKYRELEAKSLSSQGNIRQAINGRR